MATLKGVSLSLRIGPLATSLSPEPLIAALESAEVTEATGRRSGYQITFTYGKTSPIATEYLPSGMLDPMNRVILVATLDGVSRVLADGPIKDRGEAVERAHFERDRETILAMAGDFKVRFDMQESTPWMAGYEPLDRKISGGHESVRVIEDTGTKIILQHLLVVGAEGEEFVIKHWRQDWEYEPEKILA